MLLAAAYRRAPATDQAALREALATGGDLEILRRVAITGGSAWVPWVTAAEWHGLTARLAAGHDWAGLWGLAKELPVLDAAIAVAAIDGAWQPGSHHERTLFTLFAGADPAVLAPAREALLQIPGLADRVRISGPDPAPLAPEPAALIALAYKCQASWEHADLATARGTAPLARRYPPAWPFLDLLLQCLEHRFGSDIRLGFNAALMEADEIGISRQEKE